MKYVIYGPKIETRTIYKNAINIGVENILASPCFVGAPTKTSKPPMSTEW